MARSCEINISSNNWGASITDSIIRSSDPIVSALVENQGISNFLSIATVAAGERPAGRLIVSPNAVKKLMQLIREIGASCHLADFYYTEKCDAVPGTHHRGSFVSTPTKDSRAVLYFGMKPEYAQAAEAAELTKNHLVTAELFGYPNCCAQAFHRSLDDEADKLPGTITHIGPFPRLMNPINYYVYGTPNLLFHFPCSPNCLHSARLLESRRAFLAALINTPNLLMQLGEGIAIYGPDTGIGLITKYQQLSENIFEIREVATRSTRTKLIFEGKTTTSIQLIDAHKFRIETNLYSGKLTFAAMFQ